MGKGDADTRSPNYQARRESHDRIFGQKAKNIASIARVAKGISDNIDNVMLGALLKSSSSHPFGACGSHCENCVGGCCGE